MQELVDRERVAVSRVQLLSLVDFARQSGLTDDERGRAAIRQFYPIVSRLAITDPPLGERHSDDAWLAACTAYALERSVSEDPAVRAFRTKRKPPLWEPGFGRESYFEQEVAGFLEQLAPEGHAELAKAARLVARKVGCSEPLARFWIVTGLVLSPQPEKMSVSAKRVGGRPTRSASLIGVMRLVAGKSHLKSHLRLDLEDTEKVLWPTAVHLASQSRVIPKPGGPPGDRAVAIFTRALELSPTTRAHLEPLVHPPTKRRPRRSPS